MEPPGRRKRSIWAISAKEARAHAVLLATFAWVVSIVMVALPGTHLVTGQAKWTDFVHFYTLGNIARTGPISLLYDEAGQHARQTALLPAYSDDFFRPDTYPPLLATAFAPLSALPYMPAGLVWGLTTITLYVASVLWVRRRADPDSPLRDRRFVLAGALAFPPIWSLVLHGQTTIFPFLSFLALWIALDRGRPFLGGLAVGTIAMKPQLGVVIALVAILSREWRLVAGAVTSIALQAAVTASLFGSAILWRYVQTSIDVARTAHVGETKPYLQHSLRVITTLAPDRIGPVLLALCSAVVVWAVFQIWQSTTDSRIRVGAVVIGSVLVNPHLYVYDATLLVLAGLWIGDVVGYESWLWQRAYWITAAFLFPIARLVPIQVSVLLMIELLYQVWQRRHLIASNASVRTARC